MKTSLFSPNRSPLLWLGLFFLPPYIILQLFFLLAFFRFAHFRTLSQQSGAAVSQARCLSFSLESSLVCLPGWDDDDWLVVVVRVFGTILARFDTWESKFEPCPWGWNATNLHHPAWNQQPTHLKVHANYCCKWMKKGFMMLLVGVGSLTFSKALLMMTSNACKVNWHLFQGDGFQKGIAEFFFWNTSNLIYPMFLFSFDASRV